MEVRKMQVEDRGVVGTSRVKQLRREGYIPAVIYSGGKTAQSLKVTQVSFRKSTAGCSSTQLYTFESAQPDLNGLMALIKDIQMEPIKEKVIHVDFLAVSEDQKITLPVPIKLQGESPMVKAGEALLNFSSHEVEIECLPKDIPANILVDISTLELGDSIHGGDLVLPDGVSLKEGSDLVIVSVIAKMEEEVAAPVVEAAATTPVEGAATPAAEDGGEEEK